MGHDNLPLSYIPSPISRELLTRSDEQNQAINTYVWPVKLLLLITMKNQESNDGQSQMSAFRL
jgi:hypothetical protein